MKLFAVVFSSNVRSRGGVLQVMKRQAMSESAPVHDPLLDLMGDQAGWVRRFAQALVLDRDVAEDVTQEVMVRAWRRPPEGRGSLRPWLATVARNLVRSDLRAASRRRERDQDFVRAVQAADTPEDRLARWQLCKTIMVAVEALDEPFRSTVMSRYYEGKSAADIARQDGIPQATVRGRLKTGLDQLRAQLDGRYGGERESWRRLLVPLVPVPAHAGPPGSVEPGSTWWSALGAVRLAGMVVMGLGVVGGVLFCQAGHSGQSPALSAGPVPGPWRPAPAASVDRAGIPPVGPDVSPPSDTFSSLADCLEVVTSRRDRRRQLEQQLAPQAGPAPLFDMGTANPGAEAALTSLFERVLADKHAPPASIELRCRDLACRLTHLWPAGKPSQVVKLLMDDSQVNARTDSWERWEPKPARDALTGEALEQHIAFLGLRRQDAGPASAGPASAGPTDDWLPLRLETPSPRDLPSCSTEARLLQHTLDFAPSCRWTCVATPTPCIWTPRPTPS